MNNIRCMIVDDEPDAVTLLQLCLKELYPHFRIVGTYSNWKDAFHSLSEHDTDILFTDICMPEKKRDGPVENVARHRERNYFYYRVL